MLNIEPKHGCFWFRWILGSSPSVPWARSQHVFCTLASLTPEEALCWAHTLTIEVLPEETPWKSPRFWWVENWNHEIFLGHWTSSASKPSIPVPWAGAVAPARGLVGGMRNCRLFEDLIAKWWGAWTLYKPYFFVGCMILGVFCLFGCWMWLDYSLSNTLRCLAESFLRVQSCLAKYSPYLLQSFPWHFSKGSHKLSGPPDERACNRLAFESWRPIDVVDEWKMLHHLKSWIPKCWPCLDLFYPSNKPSFRLFWHSGHQTRIPRGIELIWIESLQIHASNWKQCNQWSCQLNRDAKLSFVMLNADPPCVVLKVRTKKSLHVISYLFNSSLVQSMVVYCAQYYPFHPLPCLEPPPATVAKPIVWETGSPNKAETTKTFSKKKQKQKTDITAMLVIITNFPAIHSSWTPSLHLSASLDFFIANLWRFSNSWRSDV